MSEKTEGQLLAEKLMLTKKHGGKILEERQISEAFAFCEGYKTFLNQCKTEREIVSYAAKLAINNGFTPFDSKRKYDPGDKIYYVNRGKAIILAVIGEDELTTGLNITAAHIDSPRLDLKQVPLFEDSELAYFDTHYYGGIKKYQWTALPLSIHGVVAKKDGTVTEINIGDDADDPQFCVTDLLPHLAAEQMKRTLSEAIKGEDLNLLIGSLPFKDDKASELVKLNIMNILYEKYDITEADFLSAELCLVPALRAADLGFDRSMIGSYGHDDRVCAYPSLMAILDLDTPKKTAVVVLADKEEVGSDGNTGLNSYYLKNFIADLAKSQCFAEGRTVLSKSKCLSADVNAAHDPIYPDVLEKKNEAHCNYGVVLTKYTGSRGKSDTSDASAEFVAYVRNLFDRCGIIWQTSELGKVDMGGGGTVAKYIAKLDVDVVDVGVPVLSMHSPFEVVAKIDVFMAYRAFWEFMN